MGKDGRTNGQTDRDRNDEATSRFLQSCERAYERDFAYAHVYDITFTVILHILATFLHRGVNVAQFIHIIQHQYKMRYFRTCQYSLWKKIINN
jgi:hypothetical protein